MSDNTIRRPVVLGAGPVGRAVVERLVGRGLRPLVLTRSGVELDAAESVAVDAADSHALARILEEHGADVVFQCAQPPYHRWVEEFPALQRSVIGAAAATGALLVAVENLYGYGVPTGPITEDTPLAPTTSKGRVRAAMWDELSEAHASGRIQAVVVRAADFVGPGVRESAYGDRCLGALAEGRRAELMGDPDARHSVTYVPDLAEALVRAAERPVTWGRALLAPSVSAVTQRRIVELAAETLGVRPRSKRVGAATLRLAGLFIPAAKEVVELLPTFDADLVIDTRRSEAELDLAPTPLRDAVAASVGRPVSRA